MPDHRVASVAVLLRDASMSTTYKPALLKALIRACRRIDGATIPLAELGREFATMYWNQTVVYHLRQASTKRKEAEVVRRIRAIAAASRARSFADLSAAGRSEIEASMSQVLALDVLRRFHASKPSEMPLLYTWEKGDGAIELAPNAHVFLRDHGPILEVLANYYWADYLEGCNRLAPRIIQKVARDGAKRGPLVKYLKILLDDGEGACFYCDRPFGKDNRPVVDHVIPWSFLLEDPLWDLVPACAPCNASKSDLLPDAQYLDRLLARNAGELKARLGDTVSLMIDDADIRRLYQAAISVEWPRPWPRVDANVGV